MLTIRFNEITVRIAKIQSLATFLQAQGYADIQFAVAVNRCFIPRVQHAITFLKDNDLVETIMPMQGG